jgi:hypothetical protein
MEISHLTLSNHIILSIKNLENVKVETDMTQDVEMAEKRDVEMAALAERMFHPEGKNAYHIDDRTLNNLQDLADNLDAFSGKEGQWVAAWLEYLGDADVAALIQNWPDDFKPIVIARYNKLKDYHSCTKCE